MGIKDISARNTPQTPILRIGMWRGDGSSCDAPTVPVTPRHTILQGRHLHRRSPGDSGSLEDSAGALTRSGFAAGPCNAVSEKKVSDTTRPDYFFSFFFSSSFFSSLLPETAFAATAFFARPINVFTSRSTLLPMESDSIAVAQLDTINISNLNFSHKIARDPYSSDPRFQVIPDLVRTRPPKIPGNLLQVTQAPDHRPGASNIFPPDIDPFTKSSLCPGVLCGTVPGKIRPVQVR